MKNKRFTYAKGHYRLTKKPMLLNVLVIILALILQSVANISYSQSIEIYSDDFGTDIVNDTQADGDLNYYSTNQPNNGNYCIQWSGAAKYEAITLRFSPSKDLSQLVNNGYALDLYVRGAAGTDSNYSFNIRFVDTKTGDDDHPWRNLITIDNSMVAWDGQWHHLHIPLTDFSEQGSWDGAWYNPEGLFDWAAIDKFEIVGEAQAMLQDDVISFDNIYITNEVVTGVLDLQSRFMSLSYGSNQQILLKNKSGNELNFSLIDLSGKSVLKGRFNDQYVIDGAEFKKGIYILQLSNKKNQCFFEKISIQ